MPVFFELDKLPLQALLEQFSSECPGRVDPSEKDLWFQEVAVRIARAGSEGVSFLLGSIPNLDRIRLRAVLLALSFIPKAVAEARLEELKGVLVRFLAANDPELILEAIESLNHLGAVDVTREVLPLLAHPSPYVVGSALRYLSRHHPELAKPALLGALKSNEPIVRQSAIDELDDLGCSEAVPYIRSLLEDEDMDVRQAARTALANLEADCSSERRAGSAQRSPAGPLTDPYVPN